MALIVRTETYSPNLKTLLNYKPDFQSDIYNFDIKQCVDAQKFLNSDDPYDPNDHLNTLTIQNPETLNLIDIEFFCEGQFRVRAYADTSEWQERAGYFLSFDSETSDYDIRFDNVDGVGAFELVVSNYKGSVWQESIVFYFGESSEQVELEQTAEVSAD